MRQLWFKADFVKPILAGEKTDTYRTPTDRLGRSRLPRVGEIVALSVGAGAARTFAEAEVTAVERTAVAQLAPERLALVRSMCLVVGAELVRIAFRVTRPSPDSFVPVHA